MPYSPRCTAVLICLLIFGFLVLPGCANCKPPACAADIGSQAAKLTADDLAREQLAGDGDKLAEPVPAPQPQAPAISLELDKAELHAGAKLFGQVRGSWGTEVARLLWIDGVGRVVCALELKPPAEESRRSFRLAQPAGCVGQRQQLVVVRLQGSLGQIRERRNSRCVQYCGAGRFRVLPPAYSWDDYVVLLGDGCENADPAFWRGLGGTASRAESSSRWSRRRSWSGMGRCS